MYVYMYIYTYMHIYEVDQERCTMSVRASGKVQSTASHRRRIRCRQRLCRIRHLAQANLPEILRGFTKTLFQMFLHVLTLLVLGIKICGKKCFNPLFSTMNNSLFSHEWVNKSCHVWICRVTCECVRDSPLHRILHLAQANLPETLSGFTTDLTQIFGLCWY